MQTHKRTHSTHTSRNAKETYRLWASERASVCVYFILRFSSLFKATKTFSGRQSVKENIFNSRTIILLIPHTGYARTHCHTHTYFEKQNEIKLSLRESNFFHKLFPRSCCTSNIFHEQWCLCLYTDTWTSHMHIILHMRQPLKSSLIRIVISTAEIRPQDEKQPTFMAQNYQTHFLGARFANLSDSRYLLSLASALISLSQPAMSVLSRLYAFSSRSHHFCNGLETLCFPATPNTIEWMSEWVLELVFNPFSRSLFFHAKQCKANTSSWSKVKKSAVKWF